MSKNARIFQSMILLLISIATLISYSPSLKASYFCDDYQFKFHDIQINLNSILTPTHVYAFRPLEKLFLAIMQHKFPEDTWQIHTTHIILHLLFSILLVIWMRRMGFSRLSSIMAFGIMALSQANSYALSSLDTFSQITSTLFGYSCLVLYAVYLKKQTKSTYWFYIFSITLSIIAILCKENAMFIVPAALMLAIVYGIRKYSYNPGKTIALVASAAPFVLVSVAFMALRKHLNLMPAEIGPGKFNIGLGFNILKNFFISVVQTIQPHSSVSVYLDITNKHWLNVVLVFLFSAILAMITIRGIIIGKYRKLSLTLILLLPFSMFPVILLNEINELYVYNMTPLIAVLLSIGLSQLIEQPGKQFWKAGILLFFCAFLFWNSVSVFNKCKLMNQNGIESENIHRQIEPFYSQIPLNGNLILINPNTSSKTEYSIFKRTGFRQIQFGAIELVRRSRRSDFHVRIVMERELDTVDIRNSLVLRYRDGIVNKVNLYDNSGRVGIGF